MSTPSAPVLTPAARALAQAITTRLGEPLVGQVAAVLFDHVRGGDSCRRVSEVAATLGSAPSALVAALNAAPRAVRVATTELDPEAALEDLRPVVLVGDDLYLQRRLAEEQVVAHALLERCQRPPTNPEVAAALLERLDDTQRQAVRSIATAALTVLTGGPGTGKTTTVAAGLAALAVEAASAGTTVRIAACAPTGKAAARLNEALHAAELLEVTEAIGGPRARAQLEAISATTIHRLLGVRPTSPRWAGRAPVEADVVVVDEVSMVPLELAVQLVEATARCAHLVLVGDPGQLESVEVGSFLADLVEAGRADTTLGPSLIELTTSHRTGEGSAIPTLARHLGRGEVDEALELLAAGPTGVRWMEVERPEQAGEEVAASLRAHLGAVGTLAEDPDVDPVELLERSARHRILCGPIEGGFGVRYWNERALVALHGATTVAEPPGTPVLITANDEGRGLRNGEVGVVVAGSRGPDLVVPAEGGVLRVDVVSVVDRTTAYAMTVHKSQGSEYDHVVVVVPASGSPLCTRELLYTAITRARRSVLVVGSRASIAHAGRTPSARHSGLARWLGVAR